MSIDIEINTHAPLTHTRRNRRLASQPRPVPHKPAPLPIRIFWRLRQFVRGVFAHVDADEMLVVAGLLPKAALCRFCEMPLDGQRHSLNVLYTLHAAGWDDPELAAAALLHDVGKSAGQAAGIRLTPWLRGPLVLLNALAPAKIAEWAGDSPAAGWRYLLHIHQEHPAIGAAWAAADGCSELTCWLIAHHQNKPDSAPVQRREELLALLQWADSRN
jgi:HD domain